MLGYLIFLAVMKATLSVTVDALMNAQKLNTSVSVEVNTKKNKMVSSVRRATLDLSLRHHVNPWAVVVVQNSTNIG